MPDIYSNESPATLETCDPFNDEEEENEEGDEEDDCETPTALDALRANGLAFGFCVLVGALLFASAAGWRHIGTIVVLSATTVGGLQEKCTYILSPFGDYSNLFAYPPFLLNLCPYWN